MVEEIPTDIVELLMKWIRQPEGDDERWWSKGENHGDAFSSYLNSVRGAAFQLLMRIFDNQEDAESIENKWSFLEFAVTDASVALRVGTIRELSYMLNVDRQRSFHLFQQLLFGYPDFLESMYTREFLYWALYKNFLGVAPYIDAMMNSEKEKVQIQGAQLASIADISPKAMESSQAEHQAHELADKVVTGSAAWRRGGADVYADNMKRDSIDIAIKRAIELLAIPDTEVKQSLSRVFLGIQADQFVAIQQFIDVYTASEGSLSHQFIESMLNYGLLQPVWTLSTIKTILQNIRQSQTGFWLTGVDDLSRLTIRIYTDPIADDSLKTETMNVFDTLMENYSNQVQGVLQEWDAR